MNKNELSNPRDILLITEDKEQCNIHIVFFRFASIPHKTNHTPHNPRYYLVMLAVLVLAIIACRKFRAKPADFTGKSFIVSTQYSVESDKYITDNVPYDGLVPGKKYTITTTLYNA